MSEQKIYGIHAVNTILKKSPKQVEQLWLFKQGKNLDDMRALAQENKIAITSASKQQLHSLVGHDKHQGVVAQISAAKTWHENDLMGLLEAEPNPFVLILDGIQDPHNLGACFRVADAAGVHAIIAPKDRSVGITSAVRKVACGAAESCPFFQVTNLARTMDTLKNKGFWLYGFADSEDNHLFSTDFSGAVALVMGAEGAGLRRLTKQACDHLISIPMSGVVSSMNVSTATAVAAFEVVRQRTVQ